MSDETAQLKRDGTMDVTAQEGKEFLEAQGVKVTDDDVKTRGQKEKLEQITSGEPNGDNDSGHAEPNGDANETEDNKDTENATAEGGGDQEVQDNDDDDDDDNAKLKRTSTMAQTAEEGAEILGGKELEKTRGQTAAKDEATTEKPEDNEDAKLKRTSTIAQTTEDSHSILGNEEYGKTRSQTRKFSESEEKKPAVKRTSTMAQTAKEGEEFLARESKRAKEEGGEEETVQQEAVEMAED